MQMKTIMAMAALFGATAPAASAASFTNGGFESGTFAGWTLGAGVRGSTDNASLTTAALLPGGALYNSTINHSAVIGTGYVDPNVGNLLGTTVYSGNYSARIEDTTSGGYASVVSQTVTNYTEATACDTKAFATFFHAMLDGGVYLAPSQFEALFVGLAHDDAAIEATIQAARNAFAAVAESRTR